MSDLTPPPARHLPPAKRQRLRAVLDAETHREVVDRRGATYPVLAAAVAGVLAVGGVYAYQVRHDSSGSDGQIAPAGGPSANASHSTSPQPKPPQSTPSAVTAPLIDPDDAYAQCQDIVQRSHGVDGDSLEGRVSASDGTVTTVVVSDGTDVYACNVDPDRATSRARPDAPDPSPGAGTFAFALNDARNFGAVTDDGCEPGIVIPRSGRAARSLEPGTCDPSNPQTEWGPLRRDLSWAGGRLPAGVTSVTYVFPDGHEADAIVDGGYWVMQDLAPYWANNLNGLVVTVELDGPGGASAVDVPLGIDTVCNQVNHGC